LIDLSLRDYELLCVVLCGKWIGHSTFGKANNRISYHYLKKMLIMIGDEICQKLEKKERRKEKVLIVSLKYS